MRQLHDVSVALLQNEGYVMAGPILLKVFVNFIISAIDSIRPHITPGLRALSGTNHFCNFFT